MMAPIRPPKMTAERDDDQVDHAGADGLGHGGAEAERREEVEVAAQTTACPGVRTRVETTVAIELAAS